MAAPQKDGYKFITRPYPKLLDDIEITGTLLPDRQPLIREIDGVATEVQPLRGEDIAWLLEVDEVLFFINPSIYSSTDPIIDWFRDCGGTLQKFWKLDEWRVEALTYYYVTVYDFTLEGLVYYFTNRLHIPTKNGMSTLVDLYPLRKNLPDSMIDMPSGFFSSDWFSENYLLRPSDVNMVLRDENPYQDSERAKILSAPISETIKNYSQIPRGIISYIDTGNLNTNLCYEKNIYHVYSNGDITTDTNVEETAESLDWINLCSFDGTQISFENAHDQQNLKLYIGELQDVKIVYVFRYRCRQYGEVVTFPGPVTDIYKDVDIDIEYNFTTLNIGSEFIHKDPYGIRYIEIPVTTLCTRLKEKILNLMGYTSFVERECPSDGHAEYRDVVEIGSRRGNFEFFLVGNLPSNLPPLAH